eukprot:scaffold325848_cov61-Tisochrysis_lutea.AAC.4
MVEANPGTGASQIGVLLTPKEAGQVAPPPKPSVRPLPLESPRHARPPTERMSYIATVCAAREKAELPLALCRSLPLPERLPCAAPRARSIPTTSLVESRQIWRAHAQDSANKRAPTDKKEEVEDWGRSKHISSASLRNDSGNITVATPTRPRLFACRLRGVTWESYATQLAVGVKGQALLACSGHAAHLEAVDISSQESPAPSAMTPAPPAAWAEGRSRASQSWTDPPAIVQSARCGRRSPHDQ